MSAVVAPLTNGLDRWFPLAAPVLRRLFARKVVLMAALLLTFVVSVATVYPWLSAADPNEINVSERLFAPS